VKDILHVLLRNTRICLLWRRYFWRR